MKMWWTVVAGIALSCSSPPDRDGEGVSDGGVDASSLDPDAGEPCVDGARACAAVGSERECRDGVWVETACETHAYCLTDRCAPGCLDECGLGETRDGARCEVWSEQAGGFVPPPAGGHMLARRHLGWLRRRHLANGYVANTLFTNPYYTTPQAYTGTVDAAEWTGVLLAAEALRALTTRSPDAVRVVEATIERIWELFDVTGTPGYMARMWAPLGADPLLTALYDPDDWSHVTRDYRGGPAFYQAWTSRDMYAGVALGLGLAYDATSSERHRGLIREVAVTLARQLIQRRDAVPVRVRYHALGGWQQADLSFDLGHTILIPNEMVDGRVFIQIGSEADPSDYGASELRGAREFVPDLQVVLGQTPVIGGLVPPIPRPGSALMLASFMELALHVTDGVAGAEADRAAIAAHYQANRAAWLAVMRQYAYHNEESCWSQYFGLAIAHHPTYALLRMTDDPAYAASVRREVLGARMRPFVRDHRNAYFDFIAASQGEIGLVPAAELQATVTQLAGFVAPPKAAVAVDNRGAYPASAECPLQATRAVAIGDRVPMDFLWQHHPFRLVNEHVDARHVYPGTDYLIAYWMGRYHGLIPDDAPGTCTRWR